MANLYQNPRVGETVWLSIGTTVYIADFVGKTGS